LKWFLLLKLIGVEMETLVEFLVEEWEKGSPSKRLPAEQFLDDFGAMFCLNKVHRFTQLRAEHIELVAWNLGVEGEPYSLLGEYEVFARSYGIDVRKAYLEGKRERALQEATFQIFQQRDVKRMSS
jgi:hypothetical protein